MSSTVYTDTCLFKLYSITIIMLLKNNLISICNKKSKIQINL